MTTLASILLKDNFVDVDKINGPCLGREFLVSEIDKILDMTDNELKINFPQVTSRISTIKYGAKIVKKYFLEFKSLNDVIFTTYGLRHGLDKEIWCVMSLSFETNNFKKGETIFLQDDINDGLFIIQSGTVGTVKK